MSNRPRPREENGSTCDTGRETGMLMVGIFRGKLLMYRGTEGEHSSPQAPAGVE